MKHLCERLVDASHYLESKQMSQALYSTLHHFSLKGRQITFKSTYAYFDASKNLRQRNVGFAERCIWVADEHRRNVGQEFQSLVAEALRRFPL
ncbi:hypothetical protein BH11PSE9_BH11PSE9_11660 [soil metagenome]